MLNSPGFTRFDGNSSGTRLNNTLDDLIKLQDDAKKNILNTRHRFFLSRESKAWFDEVDGKLLSSIETTDSNDLQTDSLF